jgi:hypothetical protein
VRSPCPIVRVDGRRPSRVVELVDSAEGIYCDVLADVFRRMTGLETSLGTMGR